MQLSAKLTNGLMVFERYRLKRLLGRGGMGVVWLAHDTELEKDIALKFLSEHLLFDSTAVRDLKKETRRGMELSHPNIIRVYGFFSADHIAAVAMEYVEGNNLSSLRDTRPGGFFEVDEIVGWTLELCSALHYAHTHAEIVHRDLKPANLMIDHKNRLKVADFGISASISEAHTRITGTSGVRGTMLYMSPQQMLGQRPCITHDVYSLGATLYDLLTGKPVFNSGDVSLQVREVTPPSIRQRRAELGHVGEPIPPQWEETIAACLAKDAAARPRNAAEVISRLCLYDGNLASGSSVPWGDVEASGAIGSSADPTIQSFRPPLTLVSPASGDDRAASPASATLRDSTALLPAETTVQVRQSSLSALTLLMLVLCSVLGGGAVAYFAFEHGSRNASIQATAQSINRQEATGDNLSPAHPDIESPDNNDLMGNRRDYPRAERPHRSGLAENRPPRPGEPGYGPPREARESRGILNRAPDGLETAPKIGHDFELAVSGMVYRWAPPFEFMIGGPNMQHTPNEAATEVTFTQGFWIAQHETTQQEYHEVMGNAPSHFSGSGRLPVENVTWHEAMAYCAKLNELYADVIPEGYAFNLPTQAQFEYASLGAIYGFYGQNGSHNFGWSSLTDAAQTQVVEQMEPNEFLLYDMVGNVAEWTRDWYAPLPGGKINDFEGPESGQVKVVKGGSFYSGMDELRAFARQAMDPNERHESIGFRVALAPLND